MYGLLRVIKWQNPTRVREEFLQHTVASSQVNAKPPRSIDRICWYYFTKSNIGPARGQSLHVTRSPACVRCSYNSQIKEKENYTDVWSPDQPRPGKASDNLRFACLHLRFQPAIMASGTRRPSRWVASMALPGLASIEDAPAIGWLPPWLAAAASLSRRLPRHLWPCLRRLGPLATPLSHLSGHGRGPTAAAP